MDEGRSDGLEGGTFWNLTLFHTCSSLLCPFEAATNRQRQQQQQQQQLGTQNWETENYAAGTRLKTNFCLSAEQSDSIEVARTPRTHLTQTPSLTVGCFKCVAVKWSQLIKQVRVPEYPLQSAPSVPLLYFI